MNIAHLLLSRARLQPQATAVALGSRPVHSYAGLATRAMKLAAGMRRTGLVPGDRVALFMANHPDYYTVLFAAWHAGLVAVPVNAKLHTRELAWILGDAGARLCFTDQPAADAAGVAFIDVDSAAMQTICTDAGQQGPFDCRPDDAAWLFYTSGTTGTPKGATLTHRNLLFMVQAYFTDIDRLSPRNAIVHAAPLSHGSGLYGLAHFAAGGPSVIPESRGFEVDELFTLAADWHAQSHQVSMFAAPTMLVRLLNDPAARPVQGLQTLVCGGAPLYAADTLRAIERFGPRIYQLYGQGESPMTITGLPQQAHVDDGAPGYLERIASVGHARTGVEVRVVDQAGRDLPTGDTGEVITRSDCVMSGYWNNAVASARTLRGGWLHTGDLGSLDAAGLLTLKDRSKDLIISGGSNIYPREVEEVLMRHPGVLECSVVGRPHADWGEEVVAFVVCRSGTAVPTAELDALCLAQIARFKRPRDYRFMDALPKNNYGKVLKTALRKALES